MKQLTLTIMCGLPGCGKSTWISKNKKSNVVVSLDDIRRDVFGHQFHKNAEPWILALGKTMVKMLLKQDISVIVDATNVMSFMRLEWISLAKEYKAKTRLVYFDVPYEVCYQRNKQRKKGKRIPVSVLKRFVKIFQKPSDFFEFYDKTITVTE